ncbi:isochorismatase family protein [Candidatus Woesearchaeota archaeon]|nr:isochorismatase family protein [Candidatus Woesearchaeota archaeon]
MEDNISADNSLLLVIDIQEKFRPVIYEFGELVDNSRKLIKTVNLLGIPIIVTEQYPKGLGETVKELREELKNSEKIEKVSFNCFNDNGFLELIGKKGKKNLIICGIESHVCVFQTALSALEDGYFVYLASDAVSSRKKSDYDIVLRRLEREGVKLVTAEMIIFQMIEDSKDEHFKEISKIVK